MVNGFDRDNSICDRYIEEGGLNYGLEFCNTDNDRNHRYITTALRLLQRRYDEVIARTAEVAKAVLEESAVLNTDMSEQYSALREYAKGTKIKLSEQQKKEIAYYYGSYDKFRRKNFGKIRLSEEGSTLDSLWGEMSELWPEFFEPDTHELEQVQTLVNALETIKPFYENPFYDGSFDMDIDTASYDLAMRLYEEYYDIPELKTLRQKIEKEYRDRYDKRIEKIKEQEAAKRHKLIKKGYTAQQLENGVKNNLVKSEPRIAQAAQARERGNISEYKKIYEELVSEGYPSNAVIKAINNYMTMQTAAAQAKSNGDDSALSGKLEALLESGYDEDEVNRMIDEIAAELDPEAEQDKAVEEKKLYEYKDLQKALENSDVSSAKEIVEYLRANGKEDKTIRQALTKDLKSEYQEMYKSNDTEGMRRTRQMLYELNIGYDDKTFQRWIKDMTK